MNLTPEDFGFEPIDERVIFLTGASSGIGRAAAVLLARAGARLALLARRQDRLQSLREDIVAAGGPDPLLLPADLRDEDACQKAVAACRQHFGRIDVLINNAGVGFPSDLASASTEDYRRIMDTNVAGVFFLTRAVLPILIAQKRGHVVMVSSPAGGRANPVAPLYCTSKFALEGYTDGLRQQMDSLHDQGVHIRVSNVWPGGVDSEYWGDRDVPRATFMTSEEMACVLLWVVAARGTMNVNDVRVRQFRYDG